MFILTYACLAWGALRPTLLEAQTTNDPKSATSEKSAEPTAPKSAPAAPSTSGNSPNATNGTGKPRGLHPSNDDVIELIGPEGQMILIPRTAQWETFQKWLKSLDANNGPAAPAFSVSSVSFAGMVEANRDSATLDAVLKIFVNQDDADVLVPLKLNEATLLDKVEHQGTGEAQFDKFDRDTGYGCWLRGKGQHELHLKLDVPIRQQSAARRLLLTLPDSPVNTIKLVVPLAKVSVKGPERGAVKSRLLDNGRSEIQASWLGSLLDLSWQSVSELSETKAELQSRTLISAELRADSFVLDVTQTVGSIQGSFDKVSVRLPPDFEVLDVSGREVKEWSTLSGSPSRAIVSLKAPTSSPIELKWILTAKIAADATRLPAVEGFEIEDARRQIGFVVVMAWEGVNLRKREGEDRFLHPASLAELRDVSGTLPTAMGNGVANVYRFLKQPFRLVLDVRKVEPFFSAEPRHLVRLSPGAMELETTVRLRVYRGSLPELKLPWKTFKAEGWELAPSETPESVEQVTIEDSAVGNALRVRLVDRKTLADGAFEIQLQARRPIPTDGTPFDLSLPFVTSGSQKAATITVAARGNLEVEWRPLDVSKARPVTPDDEGLKVAEAPRNVTAWRWESDTPAFSANVKVQQQSIRTESLSELSFADRSISVSQRISYEIGFEKLNQVRLMVPRAIADSVRFQVRGESAQIKSLTPVFTGLEVDQQRQCRLHLEQPQLGRLEILAEFESNHAADTNANKPMSINIPVVLSSDAEYSATRVQWKTGEKLTVVLDDANWSRELGSDKTSRWKAAGAKNAIALKVSAATDAALQDFTVHRAIIRTLLSEGPSHSQALFELDRDVRELTLFLPQEVSPQEFGVWWNQKRVEYDVVRSSPTGEVELRLKLPSSADSPPSQPVADSGQPVKSQLWLDYFSRVPTHFHWYNQHRLVVPSFAATVWVAQTIWVVGLPQDQHLFTTPQDFAAQFHWQRSVLLWSRNPNFGYDHVGRVLSHAAPLKDELSAWDSLSSNQASSNVYPLSCFGPAQPLVFWSMSRSLVVGYGAGLALLLGFLLIRIPATRHVMTFLVVGFAMALTALWFSEPVKILLQPAILGGGMAVIAALIDRVGHRGRQMPLVPLSSPSDFYAASSSFVQAAGMAAGADAPTVAPHVPLPSEQISASDRGGRE
jgi:hypothetical protein